MKVGIDLDGVVANLMKPFLKEINKKFGLELKYEDITSYHFSDCIPVGIKDLRAIWENPEFVLNKKPIPWARWGINQLRDLGYKIYIVTARKRHLKAVTLEWLEKYEILFDDIVTGKQKEKGSYIERNGLDIFIEDRTKNALEAAKFCKRVYLVDKPYNRCVVTLDESKSNIIRVNGWRDIIRSERGFLNESNSMR